MRTIEQKLASLDENDVWLFTKQTAVFDEAFKMIQLFSEIDDIDNVNIQQYFIEHHQEYDIDTHNHRALVIPQMFGLLTKTPFFERGTQYKREKPTAVFEELQKYDIGSPEYNTIKTEQLIKVRMKSIIDTEPRGYDQVILPIVFAFAVLWELNKCGISSVTEGQFYTYIMTCKSYSELDEAVTLLKSNPEKSKLLPRFKSKSRMSVLLDANCNIFIFEGGRVSINSAFGEYFHKAFFSADNVERMNLLLDRPADYAYFLYNHQDFGINLIDKPTIPIDDVTIRTPKIIEDINNTTGIGDDDNNYDAGYVNLVDKFKEDNINTKLAEGASTKEPQYATASGRKSISKNPVLGKIAVINADYKCVSNVEHQTFESKVTGKAFMEAHHLIPIKYAQQVWNDFGANIDCVENLVSLCPNCHRAVHYGSKRVKQEILARLLNKKQNGLKAIGIDITLQELIAMY